jgi:hypothetical protein
MEQRRLAVSHMFGIPFEHTPDLFPYGIYTKALPRLGINRTTLLSRMKKFWHQCETLRLI